MTARRITFVISSLAMGGAERVMTTMANHWATAGAAISLITLTPRETAPGYRLDERVARVGLGRAQPSQTPLHAAWRNLDRILALRTAILRTRPDVVISFMDTTNIVTLLATRGLGLPVIVAEHTDPGLKRMHPVWTRLRLATYPRATRLVVLGESSKTYFPPSIQQRTQIIPNPVAISPSTSPVAQSSRPHIAAMGRFGPEKGFDQLITAFATIAPKFPTWDLVIWGDGPLRPELERHRDELGLHQRILLPGLTTAPHDVLREAAIFALSSRREAFPMVLAEALACGLPAVAVNISSAIPHILRDGIDGYLVPSGDMPAFAASLASLMADDVCRQSMARRAPEVLDRYGVEPVMRIWDELIEDVC